MAAEKFYFAWVDATDNTFDLITHARNDESVYSFSLDEQEGDFATLTVEIKNPRVGLLAAGRKVWAWFSFDDGGGTPVPLFFGRLTAIPDNIFDTVITLKLTARPVDFVEQKTALAATLKVAPYYDPIFIAPESWADPDAVLEGYTKMWHVDPVTHVVTTSDILNGEDGVVTVDPDFAFYDSLSMTMQQVPLSSVTINATIPWTNSGQGDLDITGQLMFAFGVLSGRLISSYTMSGLIQSWPQAGARMGDGWSVKFGQLEDQTLLAAKPITLDDFFDTSQLPYLAQGSIVYPPRFSGKTWAGIDGAGYEEHIEQVVIPIGYAKPSLILTYVASRKYAESVTFTMKTNMQPIATAADDDEAAIINISANDVSEYTEDGTLPIGDVSKTSFVDSPRGQDALAHLTMIARAQLAIRSRAVQISFMTTFKDGRNYSLRKNAEYADERLPGGVARGKIIAISNGLNGDDGAALTTVTMACSVGYGGAYETEIGDPTYVEDGYVDDPYQARADATVLVGTGDVSFTPPIYAPNDDGLNIHAGLTNRAVQLLTVDNKADTQRTAVLALDGSDQQAVQSKLQNIPTRVNLKMVPIGSGPYLTPIELNVSDLIIPAQIDLEAASG